MNKALSNIDIETLLHTLDGSKLNFLPFDDIDDNTTLEDVFDHRGHVVLFQSGPAKVGHWVAMTRNGNNDYVFFDSYGRPLSYFSKKLQNLLKGTLYNNEKQYQENNSSVCGRYAFLLVGLNKLTNGNDTQKAITQLLNNKPKQYTYDEFVYELTK